MPAPSDLPPGVTLSMIPGNRPEDEWWEKFYDKLQIPDDLMEFDPEYVARWVNSYASLLSGTLPEMVKQIGPFQQHEPQYTPSGDSDA